MRRSHLAKVVKTTFLLLALTLLIAEPASSASTTAPIQNPANGHYYELVEVNGTGVNWYEARDAAAAMEHEGAPGHLATVTSAQEEDFLVSTFPEIMPAYVWLGASDEAEEGNWQWITGEAWDYTDWDPGEPNGGTRENCLDYSDSAIRWNDESCERRISFYLVEYPPSAIAIPVDVKPRSCPNPLNVNSRGKLPVAIQGTDAFDVSQVDPASVRLEGVAPLRWALEDVAAPYEPFVGKADARDCIEDGPDGYLDLTLKFDTQEMVAALGAVDDGEVRVLELTGNLKQAFGGTPIVGEDVVVILKKGKK